MGKHKVSKEKASHETKAVENSFVGSIALDPTLTNLFSSSVGPAKASSRKSLKEQLREVPTSDHGETTELSEPRSAADRQDSTTKTWNDDASSFKEPNSNAFDPSDEELFPPQRRKRKRKLDNENLEERYLENLEQETAKEDAERLGLRGHKRQRQEEGNFTTHEDRTKSNIANIVTGGAKVAPTTQIPQHESLAPAIEELELEKASRTVFLANVSTIAIKSKIARKTLIDHLESFISSLPQQDIAHKVDSLRFRSTAFSTSGLPKKAAYIKKELMDSTTKGTNAYAVYTTQMAAREAVKALNGSVVLDRHLRVDSIAHPAKHDHRRCVFVGNVGFVDDESMMNAAKDEENNKPARKAKAPADVEEGLWRQFSKAGVVESVRVVRDRATRVGKGFAYVQFQNANGVEKALLFDKKRFPPMLPRTLRVTRAKHQTNSSISISKPYKKSQIQVDALPGVPGAYKHQVSPENRSLSGRANKLFGRAGAVQLNRSRKEHRPQGRESLTSGLAESIVFEGYRASKKQQGGTIKTKGLGKKKGKPKTRSSKRGAAFKASGRKRTA